MLGCHVILYTVRKQRGYITKLVRGAALVWTKVKGEGKIHLPQVYIEKPKHMYRSPCRIISVSPLCALHLCVCACNLLGTQFWSGDLYICLDYSMYTWELWLFPSPFTLVHTKVAPLTNFVYYPLCFQTEHKITSHARVLAWGSD